MKKISVFLSVLLMLTVAVSGCGNRENPSAASSTGEGGGEEVREIVYQCRSMSDPFAAWLASSIKEKGSEYGFTVTVMDEEDDPAKSVEMLENAMNKKPAAILLQPNANAQILSIIRESQEKGIPVIAVNLPLPEDPSAVPTVVCDDYSLGATLAKEAAENLPENANVVFLNGIPGMSVTTERRRGFQEALLDARSDITLLEEQDANFNKDEAMNIMDDWLQKHDNIDGVLAASDGMVLGAIESFKSNGRDYSGVQFYGIDGLADACLSIESGEETASVLQNANEMAAAALEMTRGVLDGSITGTPTTTVEPEIINKENVATIIAMHKENDLL